MKKAIILTASTGGGHNKVAQTIKTQLLLEGYQVEVVDFLKSQNKIYEIVVSHGYELLASKFPQLYGELYKLSNSDNISTKVISAIRRSERVYTKRMIKETEPDLIITTHPFAAAAVGSSKEKNEIHQPVISIVTDFIAHKSYVSQGIDHYIVGSEFTKKRLVEMGILESKVHALGIPVSEEFYEKVSEDESTFTILVMGGSMGLNQMNDVVNKLIRDIQDVKLLIVTGSNTELYKSLSLEYEKQIQSNMLEIYGFTNEVAKLMDRAHLIVTKPGGLTVSEAIIKELPLVVPFYIPGQEYENLMFLSLHGAALAIEHAEVIPMVVEHLKENEVDYKRMKEGIKSLKEHTDKDGFMKIIRQFS